MSKVYKRTKMLTEEQHEYLVSIQWDRSAKECAEIMNERYSDLNLADSQIKGWRARHHIKSGRTGRFEKGIVPANKGKKLSPEQYAKAYPTMFKKGNTPLRLRPVGSERIDTDGYVMIKVKEPNVWRLKSRHIWELNFGPLTKDQIVVMLDGNRENFSLYNLAVVSRAVHARLNQRHLRYSNRELTKSGIALAEVMAALGAKRRSGNGRKTRTTKHVR